LERLSKLLQCTNSCFGISRQDLLRKPNIDAQSAAQERKAGVASPIPGTWEAVGTANRLYLYKTRAISEQVSQSVFSGATAIGISVRVAITAENTGIWNVFSPS
jgi:hypothetical protein